MRIGSLQNYENSRLQLQYIRKVNGMATGGNFEYYNLLIHNVKILI